MPISKGTRIGPYEITGLLGAGGMGEVYRARDSKLNRDVAIKVLPTAFANDPHRMARFQREAQVLASLNHPNIAAIYGLEESGGTRALIMELVEGPTLGDGIHSGPIPEEEALQIAAQIADALEYAHEHGIVHRDLKPANIKITPDGTVKLLDFGLAKAFDPDPITTPVQDSPTLTLEATRAGVILGTAAYMSPEQARGKAVDKRADIWAFGVVLYEMLTGKALFEGETTGDILAAVLRKDPELLTLPANIRYVVERCLRKDPRKRWQSIADVRMVFEEPPVSPIRARTQKNRIPMAWAGAATVVAVLLGFQFLHRVPQEAQVLKVSVLPPQQAAFSALNAPALSPDGRHLVYVATTDGKDSLWIRDLDSIAAHALPGTDGAYAPFWSPDSRSIAFFADGRLKREDVLGSVPLNLCDAPVGRGGSWSKHDIIVFARDRLGGLFRVSASGGSVRPVTTLDPALGEESHRFPWFLPDGRHFLYMAGAANEEERGIYLAEIDSGADSKARRRILHSDGNAIYASPGYLLFLRGGTLMAQPFDADKAKADGDPIPIVQQVDYLAPDAYSLFSSSQNGVLVYVSGGAVLQLTWFDRSGKAVGTVGTPGVIEWPTVSPDGNSVAIDRLDPQTGAYDL